MLGRAFRYRGSTALQQIYRRGKQTRTAFLAVKYVVNTSDTYHLAVVVSRKVHKSAVVRNRIRRRLYEAFRLDLQSSPINADMVCTVFSDKLATLPPEALQRDVQRLITNIRSGILPQKTDSHGIVNGKEE